ncbi:MAG: FHA domain-containing protein [Acidimicrobiia bacterium]
MSDTIVNVSKVAFVALLYLFLFYVARAVRGHVASDSPRGRRPEAAEPLPLPVLVVTAPGTEPRTIDVRKPLVVGRSAQADVTIEDAFASDQHARFDTAGGRLYVQDLGSTNGTTLNGERVTERRVLARGDTIRIGATIMEVR